MGYDEQLSKPEGRRGDPTAKFCALAAAAIFLAVTWASVLKNEPTKLGWFAFHPSLQSLAIFLLTYGILTLQPTSQPKTKAAGLARHQIAIFTLAFPLLVLGTVAVWYHKWLRGAAHLTTWHGILGSISMVWLLLQVLLGGGSVWSGGSAFGGGTKAKAVWKYHRLSGYVLLPMVFYTAHLGGARSNWMSKYSSYGIRLIAFTIAPALIVGAVYVRIRLSKMKSPFYLT
jgi:hypothetical protein